LQRLIDWLPSPAHLPAPVAARLLLGAKASQPARRLLANVMAQLPAAVLRARLRMVMTVDATATLASVRQPVLYLQAGQDLIVPGASATLIQRCCPQTTRVCIPGPHGLLQAEPVRAAQAMTSFLGTLR
jgi:pimeloyl-ACP methyl ester carboxylesterase